MLTKLKISGIGPAPTMEADLAPRLNIFTGDNGLGKSFLLDVIWWCYTQAWPHEINPDILSGRKAFPQDSADRAEIVYGHDGGDSAHEVRYEFDFDHQEWSRQYRKGSLDEGDLHTPMIIYGMVDGSFSVLDPLRLALAGPGHTYVLSSSEVWYGQTDGKQQTCNGMLADWAGWQKEAGATMEMLRNLLEKLSPEGEPIAPGALTRISLNDARDIPTIRMPYSQGNDVPIVHASSAIKRILSIVYILVWTWSEHLKLCKLKRREPTKKLVLLLDEIEAHLHPRWQRTVLPAIMDVVEKMTGAQIQLFVCTHSPLVMASCEDVFDSAQDAWLDFDLVGKDVLLTQRTFFPQGESSAWLASEAFDLKSDRSVNSEKLLQESKALLRSENPTLEELRAMRRKLADTFAEDDPYRLTWNALVNSKYPEINN